jgi:ribosomal-protein-alanine N-acetyltransferase
MIETPRLRLRELTVQDAPTLFSFYQDATVMRFMGPPPATIDDEIENIETHRGRYYESRGYGLWGVVLRESETLIGRCGFLDATIANRDEVELSYLLDASQWGRGLATEAARAALAFGTGQLAFTRIVAVVHPDNVRSRRVAERLSMRCEGVIAYKAFGDVDLFVHDAPRHTHQP